VLTDGGTASKALDKQSAALIDALSEQHATDQVWLRVTDHKDCHIFTIVFVSLAMFIALRRPAARQTRVREVHPRK